MKKYLNLFLLLFLLPGLGIFFIGPEAFVFILLPLYILIAILLIIPKISRYVVKPEPLIIPKILENIAKTDNILENSLNKNFFSWHNIPWICIVFVPIIKIIFNHIDISDIIILIFFFSVIQLNKNFLNSNSMYQITMLVGLVIITTIYLYVSISFGNSLWDILYFPLIRISFLILLIIIGWIDKKNQNKVVS